MSTTVAPNPAFEGVEKVLCLRFTEPEANQPNLRSAPRSSWEKVCVDAECGILSHSASKVFDAYVLSESSLFVSANSVLLKTCGLANSLRALPRLVRLGESYGLTLVSCRYSRHDYSLGGELQPEGHRSFQSETANLDQFFATLTPPDGKGSTPSASASLYKTFAKTFGNKTGASYNLYIAALSALQPEHAPAALQPTKHTLEVNMFGLCEKKMKRFWRERKGEGQGEGEGNTTVSAEEVTLESGVRDILGGTIDAYMFEPCGYSMNGLDAEGIYWTIHVTPEDGASYVSFETNATAALVPAILSRVLDTFSPSSFHALSYAEGEEATIHTHGEDDHSEKDRRVDFGIDTSRYTTKSDQCVARFYTSEDSSSKDTPSSPLRFPQSFAAFAQAFTAVPPQSADAKA